VRRLHLLVGLLGVAGFLATGQYMDRAHDHLRGYDDARRLLFRSTHLYLLFTSLVNVALGLYAAPATGWRRWPRGVGSIILIATPILAALAFFTEPWLAGLDRPYTRPTAYGCLAGVVLHIMAYKPRPRPMDEPT
jgi:hypothetical protein